MELPYRPNVCIILHNRKNLVLLGERKNQPGIFQFPQGGVEEGTLEENVYREIQEELGIEREFVEIKSKLNATHRYDYSVMPSYAEGKWRGQQQTFWLVSFLGDDSNIDVNTPHPEFMSFKWCSIDEVPVIAEPKRLSGYEAPLKEVLTILK